MNWIDSIATLLINIHPTPGGQRCGAIVKRVQRVVDLSVLRIHAADSADPRPHMAHPQTLSTSDSAV